MYRVPGGYPGGYPTGYPQGPRGLHFSGRRPIAHLPESASSCARPQAAALRDLSSVFLFSGLGCLSFPFEAAESCAEWLPSVDGQLVSAAGDESAGHELSPTIKVRLKPTGVSEPGFLLMTLPVDSEPLTAIRPKDLIFALARLIFAPSASLAWRSMAYPGSLPLDFEE